MAIDMGRVRDTSATARRADNIRSIIDTLRQVEMTRVDIQTLLKMSPSGGRKYTRELLESGVMMVAHTEVAPTPSAKGHDQRIDYFKLTEDEDLIDKLLAAIVQSRAKKAEKSGPPKTRVLTGDPTRHFHVLADDVHYQVKVPHKKIPAPDPLLAHFFGRAQVEA